MKTIILSAGGTGGHIFPALALASVLKTRGFKVIWVTDKRGLRFQGQFSGNKVIYIPSATLKAGLLNKAKAFATLSWGYIKAHAILLHYQPDCVLGFGGYPSFPTVLAAQHIRIPTILHEQNMTLGKANIMLAKRARHIALWVDQTSNIPSHAKDRTIVTGNPVRSDIAALAKIPYIAPKDGEVLRILILGGSLGASVFSDIIPETLNLLNPDQRARLHITQQCRTADIDSVRQHYTDMNIAHRLENFFEDISEQFTKAHIVITRSGASTVAELTAAGRPAIFVPYPHHADQQQKRNADYVATAGGGWCVVQSDFTPEFVKEKIESFLDKPEILSQAAYAVLQLGVSNAADRLADLVTDL